MKKSDKKTGPGKGRGKGKAVGDRLRQISQVAASLFFEKGYMQTTTREIAETADISVGTLYYYIKSKDDLPITFSQIHINDINRWEKEIRKAMQVKGPEEVLGDAVREMVHMIDLRRKMVLFWYQTSKYLTREQMKDMINVENRVVSIFKDIIEWGSRTGNFKVDDPFLTAMNIHMVCSMWALKRWWLKDDYTYKQFADQCAKMAISLVRGSTV